MTVNGSMKLTFHPASPIVREETNAKFANAFVDLLEKVATSAKNGDASASSGNFLSNVPEGTLSLAAAALGAVGLAIHAGAWSEFFSNLAVMKENVQVKLSWCSLIVIATVWYIIQTIGIFLDLPIICLHRILKIFGMHSIFGYSLQSVIPSCSLYYGSRMFFMEVPVLWCLTLSQLHS